jgi:hypothetical protein
MGPTSSSSGTRRSSSFYHSWFCRLYPEAIRVVDLDLARGPALYQHSTPGQGPDGQIPAGIGVPKDCPRAHAWRAGGRRSMSTSSWSSTSAPASASGHNASRRGKGEPLPIRQPRGDRVFIYIWIVLPLMMVSVRMPTRRLAPLYCALQRDRHTRPGQLTGVLVERRRTVWQHLHQAALAC